MPDMTVIEHIASIVDALTRCNPDWTARHNATLDRLERDYLPSGSGIDSGTKIDRERSKRDRIVLTTEFHHMDGESGMYCGWTEHEIIITPSFIGRFDVRITGRDRNEIKDYLGQLFHDALSEVLPYESLRDAA